MHKGFRILLRIILPVLVLVVGVGAAIWLVKTKPKPQRQEFGTPPTPVSVHVAKLTDASAQIEAGGTVISAKQIELRPQVSGQIIEMSEALQPGGFFRESDVILRIDPRDYEFAVARQEAELARAQFELTQEQGRHAIARQEWEMLGQDMETGPKGKALALREPQMARARAVLEAAKSGLAEARLNLERTVIRAPFNALVKQENVDIGQLITPQTPVANLTGTDRYWVRASVSVMDLAYIDLPDRDGHHGAEATIIHETGEDPILKRGSVFRLLGDLDEVGRMARLLIAIEDPLGLQSRVGERPLLLDAFVRVEILGKTIPNVLEIPATGIREGDRAWLMNADDLLEIRQVSVVRRQKDKVLVNGGLKAGDRVVTSRIGAPVPGMKLKLLEKSQPDTESGKIAGGGHE